MNNLQLELVKKKERLAELKQRKVEREQLKSAKNEASTQTPQSKSQKNHQHHYSNNLSSFNEFENLNSDQILSKLGLLTENNHRYQPDSTSSCVSVSVSSSSQSLKSNLSSTTLSSSVIFKSCNGSDFEPSFNFENLKLTSEVNLNIVDIFPSEPIRYSKETQTTFDVKLNDENESSTDDGGDENLSDKPPDKFKNNQSKKNSKGKYQKPLAYYDDIFVYDTLQWEDEYVDAEEEFSALDLIEQEMFSNESIGSIIKKALAANSTELEQMINKKCNTRNDAMGVTSSDKTKKSNQISDSNDDDEPADAVTLYSNEKNKSQIDSDDFLNFLRQKRPIIERALKQNEKNIFFDYSADDSVEKVLEESQNGLIKLKKSFCSADKSSVVTCLDWSQHYPELLLCSYDNMSFNYEEAASESVAVIWNSKSDQKVPHQNLTCSSLITSCIFSSCHPNLVIAGTYSGQIVMWDLRCNKQTPIQRSSLSISSHVNPVYCIKVVGNHDAQNLISISNDGKLCSWSLDNLNLPFETQDLCMKNASNKSVYATCFDFQNVPPVNKLEKDINSAVNSQRFAIVGAEDGYVHSLLTSNSNTSNTNRYSTCEAFIDHMGPITGVSCYSQMSADTNLSDPNLKNSYLSQLFLTSSFDGCVKLWNLSETTAPIHTFECNGDYVYDVSWSPAHPALFACVDGSGKLDIWNLNSDFELPSATYELDNRTRALNRLKWSRNGHEIVVGDDHGQITVFELNENFVRPSTDETKKFLNTINTLKQMNHDSIRSDKISYLSESIR